MGSAPDRVVGPEKLSSKKKADHKFSTIRAHAERRGRHGLSS
jgi:hypothetical protein